jgi:hypothetical protein
MELFNKLFGSLLVFVYHCFDRIVIHGYRQFSFRANPIRRSTDADPTASCQLASAKAAGRQDTLLADG